MRNKSPYVLLSACPISDPEKNGDGPDERNAESNGMIEGGRLFNGLPRNFSRLIRIALEPESPSRSDASSVAVIESEVASSCWRQSALSLTQIFQTERPAKVVYPISAITGSRRMYS
jgi:hypothetical protein